MPPHPASSDEPLDYLVPTCNSMKLVVGAYGLKVSRVCDDNDKLTHHVSRPTAKSQGINDRESDNSQSCKNCLSEECEKKVLRGCLKRCSGMGSQDKSKRPTPEHLWQSSPIESQSNRQDQDGSHQSEPKHVTFNRKTRVRIYIKPSSSSKFKY